VEYKKSKIVRLKSHPDFNEKWLQQQITDDVEILGLGEELLVKDVERRQPGAGRLDVLLSDPESKNRYEVEIQLGRTDKSHIIRTLEYWDNERRRFPQYDHIAVIVAEEITGRFLNVINLFNQAIPLIAIQMSAIEVDGSVTLHATKVLDVALPALEEEDEPGEETDRSYWQQKSDAQMLGVVDKLLVFVNEFGPAMSLKYNKYSIGLQRDHVTDNFVTFRPRKKFVRVELRIERSEQLDALIEDSGLTSTTYLTRWKTYRVSVVPSDLDTNQEVLRELVRSARGLPAEPEADDGQH